MNERSNKRTSTILFWLAALFGLALLLFLPPWLFGLYTANTLERGIAAKGEPITLAELAALHPAIPDELNAAIPLLQLWESEQGDYWARILKGERVVSKTKRAPIDSKIPFLNPLSVRSARPSGTNRLDPAVLAAAEKLLAERQAHMRAVRDALQRPQFRFPLRFSDGASMLIPHLSELRIEASWFELEALIATEHDDAKGAIAAIRSAAKIGQLLADEGLIVSQLDRIEILNLNLESVERLLSRLALSSDELLELNAVLEQSQIRGALRQALIGERVFALSNLSDPRALAERAEWAPNPKAEIGSKLPGGALGTLATLTGDRRLILETYSKAIALSAMDQPEDLAAFDQVFQEARSEVTHSLIPKPFSDRKSVV